MSDVNRTPSGPVRDEVLRATPAALLAFDADGALVLANAAARDLLDGAPADLRELVATFAEQGAVDHQVVEVLDALRSGGPASVRVGLAARGTSVVVDVSTSEQVDGSTITVVSIFDVTQVDRQSLVRDDLVAVLGTAPYAIMLLTPVEVDGHVTDFEVAYANETFQEAIGRPVPLGVRLGQLDPPLGRTSFGRYRAVWESGERDVGLVRFESEGLDEWFDVRVTPMREAVLVALQPATERVRAQEELNGYKELLRVTQSVAKLGSYEWYVGRDKLSWTEQMYEVVQVDPETFGHTYADFLELIHPDDRVMIDERMREVVGHGVPFSGDMRRVLDDGRTLVLHSEGRMVYERGKVPRFVGTLQDVTEARALEEAIRRTQRVASLGQMAAGVAHDFNNILTVVTMNAHLLRDQLEGAEADEQVLSDLAGIEAAVGRATNLTRQLLAFTGQQVRRPVVLDLGAAVTEVLPMLERLTGEGVVLDVDAEPGTPVRADRTQVEQVVLNLVVNARDAVEGVGTVRVRVRHAAGDHPAVARSGEPVHPASRWALLEVADDGHGMSEEVQERALDPFFTTKGPGQGTGLGLSVVFGIVQQSEGRIAIDSAPGRGTTVTVALPLEAAEVSAAGTAAEPPPATGDETVLLVEDDPAVRALAARALHDHGYEVVQAGDGEEALATLAERPDVAAVVSDVGMPGMGGIELLRAVRRDHPGVAMLLMSGYTRPDELPEDPLLVFVPKPITGDGLASALRRMLDR